METWWFVILIAAVIVALIAFFMRSQYFMSAEDTGGQGRAETAPDFHERTGRSDEARGPTGGDTQSDTFQAEQSGDSEPDSTYRR